MSAHSKTVAIDGKHHAAAAAQAKAAPETAPADSVLIIGDDAEFARSVVGRWQSERTIPAFTLMGSDVFTSAVAASHALAIVGPRAGRRELLLKGLEATPASVLCVTNGESAAVREAHPRFLVLRDSDGWLDVLVQVGAEILRRSDASRRVQRAEELTALAQRHATLGRYMLEMRHSLNNCLTSVLGNAELLLLEPGTLNSGTREQVETIHTMALRMHEVLQRFSSLESEMQFAEKSVSH
jgi:signal transduction histidine kinase